MTGSTLGNVLVYGAIFSFLGFQMKSCAEDNQKAAIECKEKHKGQDYTIEKVGATMENGCVISEVELYNGSCRFVERLYVNSCAGGVKWKVRSGKTTVEKSTQTVEVEQ